MNSHSLAKRINREVNASVSYKTDLEQYSTPEFWKKAGDFVTFFANGTDCVVSRLLSDDAIRVMIYMELANNPSGLLATEIKNLAMSAVAEGEEK